MKTQRNLSLLVSALLLASATLCLIGATGLSIHDAKLPSHGALGVSQPVITPGASFTSWTKSRPLSGMSWTALLGMT